jgi:flagellar biosynthetic protein FliQ
VNQVDALELTTTALWAVIYLSAPLVLPAMLVGVLISVFQALTQVQESTLTFVPKMVVVFFAAMLSATFMGAHLGLLADNLYGRIVTGF